jgi:hypothetical protein
MHSATASFRHSRLPAGVASAGLCPTSARLRHPQLIQSAGGTHSDFGRAPCGTECVVPPAKRRYVGRMKIRFEVPITVSQHARLEQVADEIGVSPRDLARLAIARMLNNPDEITGRKDQAARNAA